MAAMRISLTPDLEKFVDDKVRSGEYLNAGDLIRDAVRTLVRHEGEALGRNRPHAKKRPST